MSHLASEYDQSARVGVLLKTNETDLLAVLALMTSFAGSVSVLLSEQLSR